MRKHQIELEIMMDHFKEQKWFQDAWAEYEARRALRNRRQIELARRAATLPVMGPGMVQEKLKELREQIEKEVV